MRNKCLTNTVRARLSLSQTTKAARLPTLAVHTWFRALAHAASKRHHIALAPDDTVAEPSITIIAHIHAKIHADTTSIGHTICNIHAGIHSIECTNCMIHEGTPNIEHTNCMIHTPCYLCNCEGGMLSPPQWCNEPDDLSGSNAQPALHRTAHWFCFNDECRCQCHRTQSGNTAPWCECMTWAVLNIHDTENTS